MPKSRADIYIEHNQFAYVTIPLLLKEYSALNAAELLSIETPNHFLQSNRQLLANVKGTDPAQALSFTDFSKYKVTVNKSATPGTLFLSPATGRRLLYATIPQSVMSPVVYIAEITKLNGEKLRYGDEWFVLRPDLSSAYSTNKFYVLFTPLSTDDVLKPGAVVNARCLVAKGFYTNYVNKIAGSLPMNVSVSPKILPFVICEPNFKDTASLSAPITLEQNLNSTRILDITTARTVVPELISWRNVFVTPSFDYYFLQDNATETFDAQIKPFFPKPEKVKVYVITES
jgi:hypothetical protein